MRLALLSDGSNFHTRRWMEYFIGCGDELLLLTLEEPREMPGRVMRLESRAPLRLLSTCMALPAARRALTEFAPDLINAHFLPNYGWMAEMLGLRPWALSTWGSDVLINPRRSAFHMWRARRVLNAADLVTSDAKMMSVVIDEIAGRELGALTVPMGIARAFAAERVSAAGREQVIFHDRNLEPVYDLPTVLRGLAIHFAGRPGWLARLAGEGSLRGELESLAAKLGIADRVSFLGRIGRDELRSELLRASIYLSASLSDSTSVSLLEAMALGAHPVLSDIPANREWIAAEPFAAYFAAGDPEALAGALALSCDLPLEARRAAIESNWRKVTADAIWEDNMARVRGAFLVLAERGRT